MWVSVNRPKCRHIWYNWTTVAINTSSFTETGQCLLVKAMYFTDSQTETGQTIKVSVASKIKSKQTTLCLKKCTTTINMTLLHQFTKFTNYFWHRQTLFNSLSTMIKKFLNWLRTSCVVSITTVATWHTWTADFWAEFEQCMGNDRAINEWQNDCGAVSRLKDSTRTRVVTFCTTKHFIILIEIPFV